VISIMMEEEVAASMVIQVIQVPTTDTMNL
jgi:hypothetical protein